MVSDQTYYRRHLPHYQPQGATYFITFRLSGTLPKEVVENLIFERDRAIRVFRTLNNDQEKKSLLKNQRWKYYKKFDALLDKSTNGPFWLRNPAVAAIVLKALHSHDSKSYDLLAYCIMPNHVHLIFELGA